LEINIQKVVTTLVEKHVFFNLSLLTKIVKKSVIVNLKSHLQATFGASYYLMTFFLKPHKWFITIPLYKVLQFQKAWNSLFP